jgi:hypothetical protein
LCDTLKNVDEEEDEELLGDEKLDEGDEELSELLEEDEELLGDE